MAWYPGPGPDSDRHGVGAGRSAVALRLVGLKYYDYIPSSSVRLEVRQSVCHFVPSQIIDVSLTGTCQCLGLPGAPRAGPPTRFERGSSPGTSGRVPRPPGPWSDNEQARALTEAQWLAAAIATRETAT